MKLALDRDSEAQVLPTTTNFIALKRRVGVYSFGSPLFDRVIINLENGKQFEMEVINNSKENKYIQSTLFNGEEYKRIYITHKEIMQGGKLVFTMGRLPNKKDNNVMAITSKIFN